MGKKPSKATVIPASYLNHTKTILANRVVAHDLGYFFESY